MSTTIKTWMSLSMEEEQKEYVRSSSRIVGLLILLVGGQNKIAKSSSMSYIDQFLSSSFLLTN